MSRSPRVHPPRLLLATAGGSIALTALSYLTLSVGGPFFEAGGAGHRIVNVGSEANLPTWWTSMLLALGGLGFLDRARRARTRPPAAPAGPPWSSALIGGLLLAMSLDELAGFHELLVHPARALAGEVIPFTWLLLGVPLGVALIALALRAARDQPRPRRTLLLCGLAVFLAGALGLEAVGSWLTAQGAYGTRTGVAVYHLEELLEMLGAGVLAGAPLAPVGSSPAARYRRAA